MRSRSQRPLPEMLSRAGLLLLIACPLFFGGQAQAQSAQNSAALSGIGDVFVPPENYLTDANGVDLGTGLARFSEAPLTIGTGDTAMSFARSVPAVGMPVHNFLGYISLEPPTSASPTDVVVTGNASYKFASNNVEWYQNGDTFSCVPANCTLVARDGTKFIYEDIASSVNPSRYNGTGPYNPVYYYAGGGRQFELEQIIYPNGLTYTLYYAASYSLTFTNAPAKEQVIFHTRLQAVTSSAGYQLHFTYLSNTLVDGKSPSGPQPWDEMASAVLINSSVDYCDPTAVTCTLAHSWPNATYATGASGNITTRTMTDALGNLTTYSYGPSTVCYPGTTLVSGGNVYAEVSQPINPMTAIQHPGFAANDYVITYGCYFGMISGGPPNTFISNVTNRGISTSYTYQGVGDGLTSSAPDGVSSQIVGPSTITSASETNPLGGGKSVVIPYDSVHGGNYGSPSSVTDELNRTVSVAYDANIHVQTETLPEGNYIRYGYDGRGNALSKTLVGKPGSGVANIVLIAGFDSTCSVVVKCNKPNFTKDALGGETDYTYDLTYGVLTSETKPTSSSGVRPQTRHTFTPLQAYFLNSSGSIVASGQAIAVQTGTSECTTLPGAGLTGAAGVGPFAMSGSAACAATSDELLTTEAYGAQTNGTANNLLPVSKKSGAGDNSLFIVTSMTHDSTGNVTSETDPNGNVRYTTYDALRRKVFEISAAPGGSLPRLITHHLYDAAGREIRTESGTGVATNGSDFTVLHFKRMTYDPTTGLLVKLEVGTP